MLNQLFRLLDLPIILLATWSEASTALTGSDPTINRRFQLQPLPSLQVRDKALKTNGMPPIGDLTNALIDGTAR